MGGSWAKRRSWNRREWDNKKQLMGFEMVNVPLIDDCPIKTFICKGFKPIIPSGYDSHSSLHSSLAGKSQP